jgi:hypothetical protein
VPALLEIEASWREISLYGKYLGLIEGKRCVLVWSAERCADWSDTFLCNRAGFICAVQPASPPSIGETIRQ